MGVTQLRAFKDGSIKWESIRALAIMAEIPIEIIGKSFVINDDDVPRLKVEIERFKSLESSNIRESS